MSGTMDGGTVRVSLLQIDVDPAESVASRRDRVAELVRVQSASDLVVLPELWTVGAFASDLFAAEAEAASVDAGPTAGLMSAAAADAGVWLHAGSIPERTADGSLYNTSLLFSPDGRLHRTYRKIHRFGFDRGEAVLMSAGEEIVTAQLSDTAVLGLATCYDLRFPELFRLLVDAGAGIFVIPAGWPERRREHWTLLAKARAIESQAYVLAVGTAGTHAGVELAGHTIAVDPWGAVLAEAGPGEEVLTLDLDPALVAKTRADFPVLRDRLLGLPAPDRG